jgi:penicillin-binding protein 1C
LLTTATLLADTPYAIRDTYSDYDPQNFNHHYLGPVRVREALACSLNVPAIVATRTLESRHDRVPPS